MFGDFIYCNSCIYFEDCEDKESRDGCYCGETDNDFQEDDKNKDTKLQQTGILRIKTGLIALYLCNNKEKYENA